MPVDLHEERVVFKHNALTHSTNDQELVRCLISRNCSQQAFKILHDRYYTLLYKKALQRLNCHFSAEEAVADVFLKIWSNRDALQACLKLRAYLFTAVYNQCIDYVRKRRAEEYYAPEQFPALELAYSSPEQAMVDEELRNNIQKAISELPPKGRIIFRLSREEGLKYSEIAERLDISVKTVESHMRRSLFNLRHQFRERYASRNISYPER